MVIAVTDRLLCQKARPTVNRRKLSYLCSMAEFRHSRLLWGSLALNAVLIGSLSLRSIDASSDKLNSLNPTMASTSVSRAQTPHFSRQAGTPWGQIARSDLQDFAAS